MNRLAEIATSNGGTILELGFGLGLSSRAIQNQNIDTHIVVECHPDVISKCTEDFASEIASGKMHILSGFWQDVTKMLKDNSFDGILFDTYPLSEEEVHSNHFPFFNEAYRLLKPGGVLTYYSDEATSFSEKHLRKIKEAGFNEEKIGFEVCNVDTPADCEYWQDETMIAPIIKK